jgi:hypothetical protein
MKYQFKPTSIHKPIQPTFDFSAKGKLFMYIKFRSNIDYLTDQTPFSGAWELTPNTTFQSQVIS